MPEATPWPADVPLAARAAPSVRSGTGDSERTASEITHVDTSGEKLS